MNLDVIRWKLEESEKAGSQTQDTSGLSCQCSATVWAFRVRKPFSMVFFSWWREFSSRPLTEFWQHILSGCQVCDQGIQYHLCSAYRGLVVVWLLWLSGRAQGAQARGVLGSMYPTTAGLFTFLYFCLITSKFIFISSMRQDALKIIVIHV